VNHGKSSIRNIALGVSKDHTPTRGKLYILKNYGFVYDEEVLETYPNGGKIMVHYWWPSEKGIKWLHEVKTPT
jgi:hypothetical protein